jgi:hypothetical protein
VSVFSSKPPYFCSAFLAKGWLEPPPWLVWGWSNHPHGQWDGSAMGVVRPPPKDKKKKKKKKGFGLLGVAGPPQGPVGGQSHPFQPVWVAEATPGPWRWSDHPKSQNPLFLSFFFFFFFFGLLGVAGPPPRALGWLRPPPMTGRGWPKPPLGPWGWSGHP